MRDSPQDSTVMPFIGGKALPSAGNARLMLVDPATGRSSTEIPAGCPEDVERAVASARAAFEDGRWSDLAPSRRYQLLHQFADLIESEAAHLDALDAKDMGKPVSLPMANAASAAVLVRRYADMADHITGDVYQGGNTSLITQRRLPRGVVGAVTPWNFPTMNALYKVAPALAAGNSVVLKPSEWSPRSAQRLAELAVTAGLPPGVFNLTPGKGETVGRALAMHKDVDMLTFTGSTAVGGLMLQYAGQSNLKLVHAECGGKSPQIVFQDFEDLDVVADHVSEMILVNQGQLCIAGSRLIVHQDIEAALIEKIVHRFNKAVIGNPLDPKSTFGPLVSEKQMTIVLNYIESGVADGARLEIGGRRVEEKSGGYYIEPTLFSRVEPQYKIAKEEIFGPVLAVSSFAGADEAVRLANATAYGLSAHVWTRDMPTGMRLAKTIRSGIVTVNAKASSGEWPAALSIEPYGHSGVGIEGGIVGLETYMRRQVMWFNYE